MSPLAPAVAARPDAVHVSTYSHNSMGETFHGGHTTTPASGAWAAANRAYFTPFYLAKPFSLARWFWLCGATLGTDYFEAGIYDAAFSLVAASRRVLHATAGGVASIPQYVTPGIHGTNLIAAGDSTDRDTYTTASVTLKAGRLYLLAFEHSHASNAPAIVSVDSATGGVPTFTSRATGQYNGTTNRVTILSAVPTADWTGTLRINFNASAGVTGAVWSVNGFTGVDTTTNDGIVQAPAIATGTSVTPLSTLAAYDSANNAGFAAFGILANATGAPTSATTFELSDTGTATPAQALQCTYTYNDTTMDETITSVAWGALSVELKSLGTGAIWIPPMRGYLALWGSGTTATLFRISGSTGWEPYNYLQSSLTAGLPETATPATAGGNGYVHGFTSRASP